MKSAIFIVSTIAFIVGISVFFSLFTKKSTPKEIIQHPDSRLHEVSTSVKKIDLETQKIASELKHVIEQVDRRGRIGLGMAAPQIGYSTRIIAIKKSFGNYEIMINPEVNEKKWFFPSLSKCFSVDGIHFLKRYYWYSVSYQDLNGNKHHEIMRGARAITLQQEIDHLDGILINDY